MSSVAIDGCAIYRSAGAGVEIIEAAPRHRSFPLRLSEGLGLCLKVGPAHQVRFEGREQTYPTDALCIRPPGSIWASDDTGLGGFLSIDIDRALLPEGLVPFATTFVPADALPTLLPYARSLAGANGRCRENEIVAALFADLDAADLLTADVLHISNARVIAWRARDALVASIFSVPAPNIETLAQDLDTNRFALMRAFKRTFGITPHAFVIGLRLEHARSRIARGLDLATVALEVGFSDQAHLTRAFKRCVGLTPGRYGAMHGRALSFKP